VIKFDASFSAFTRWCLAAIMNELMIEWKAAIWIYSGEYESRWSVFWCLLTIGWDRPVNIYRLTLTWR